MVKYRQLEGRRHAVVPVVMLTQGVLPGSQGALFYPSDEIAASVATWNGKACVVYHPMLFSTPVTATSPEVFDRQKVGVVFNATFDGRRLKAEAWIDVERVKVVDNRVWESIRVGRPMEVSTGLFVDQVPQVGVYNGRQFYAVARNFRPDHLAILPDQKGACSIKDGCGLMRTNVQHYQFDVPNVESLMAY